MKMSKCFVVLLMLFFHIVDDYYLQGLLAQLKQKAWWKEHAPQQMYKRDYIVALLMHSFSWSFMIMLPIAICVGFNIGSEFVWILLTNTLIHGMIDDLKANQLKINLITDQTIHLLQIFGTAFLFWSGVL